MSAGRTAGGVPSAPYVSPPYVFALRAAASGVPRAGAGLCGVRGWRRGALRLRRRGGRSAPRPVGSCGGPPARPAMTTCGRRRPRAPWTRPRSASAESAVGPRPGDGCGDGPDEGRPADRSPVRRHLRRPGKGGFLGRTRRQPAAGVAPAPTPGDPDEQHLARPAIGHPPGPSHRHGSADGPLPHTQGGHRDQPHPHPDRWARSTSCTTRRPSASRPDTPSARLLRHPPTTSRHQSARRN